MSIWNHVRIKGLNLQINNEFQVISRGMCNINKRENASNRITNSFPREMLGLSDSLEIFTTIVSILDTLGTKVELGLALESSRLTYSKGLRERNVEEKSRGKGQATSIVE